MRSAVWIDWCDVEALSPTRRRWWHSYEWNVLLSIALVVALGLGWLGWEASIVHHRMQMRWQLHADGGALFMRRGLIDSGPDVPGGSFAQIDALGPCAIGQIRPEEPDRGVSKIRMLLGDE